MRLPSALSFSQWRVWQRLAVHPQLYKMPVALVLRGQLCMSALNEALADVMKRHQVLRAVACEIGGAVTLKNVEPYVQLEPVRTTKELVNEELTCAAALPFRLSEHVPVRFHCFQISEHIHVLLISCHQFAVDGCSIEAMLNDLSHAYVSRLRGVAPVWTPLSISYADFASGQNARLNECRPAAAAMDYWKSHLSGLPRHFDLSCARQSLVKLPHSSSHRPIRINPALHRDLVRLAAGRGVGLIVVLQALVAATLARACERTDIPIGVVVDSRHGAFRDLVGAVADLLIIRIDTGGNPTFEELIERVRSLNVAAIENHPVSFPLLLEQSCIGDDSGRHALVQVTVGLRPVGDRLLALGDAQAEVQSFHSMSAGFDLMFDFEEGKDPVGAMCGIEGRIEFQPELFAPEAIQWLYEQFLSAIQRLLHRPGARIIERSDMGATLSVCNKNSLSHGQPIPTIRDNTQYVPPRDALQHSLVRVLEELLNLQRIGVTDDFYGLGGDTTLVGALLSRVEHTFGKRLANLTDCRPLTVQAIAEELLKNVCHAPIQEVQPRRARGNAPFYFLHGDFAGAGYYTIPLAHGLGENQPFYVLQQHGMNGLPIPDTIEAMAEDHVRRLRAFQPTGPYCLGGHCNGALIALEMARILERTGQLLGPVILIEAPFRKQAARSVSFRPVPSEPSNAQGFSRMYRTWLFSKYVMIARQYVAQPFLGKLIILHTTGYVARFGDPIRTWRDVSSHLEARAIPGDHITCIGRYVSELAASMRPFMLPATVSLS